MPRIYVVQDPNFNGNEHFHSSYAYDNQLKSWQFLGYTCVHCEKTFKTSDVRKKHLDTCRGLSRKKEKDEEPPIIFDVHGKEWQPLETNQNFSVSKLSLDNTK